MRTSRINAKKKVNRKKNYRPWSSKNVLSLTRFNEKKIRMVVVVVVLGMLAKINFPSSSD